MKWGYFDENDFIIGPLNNLGKERKKLRKKYYYL